MSLFSGIMNFVNFSQEVLEKIALSFLSFDIGDRPMVFLGDDVNPLFAESCRNILYGSLQSGTRFYLDGVFSYGLFKGHVFHSCREE